MSQQPPSIEDILAEAVEIPVEADRGAFVERACRGDAELRRKVEDLVRNHFRAGAFLDLSVPPITVAFPPASAPEALGTMIGPYKLREAIGEGGMGVVYVAEQQRPVRRKVALKIIKPGMDTREVLGRFEAERQALALMDHPNIARVLDAGATDLGRPYFVMELVRGIPITDYCDQSGLDSRERLELFGKVCLAVEHAHQKGVIHRDVKPSNVMITLQDGVPVPKVIDFGVAKAVNQRLTEDTVYTRFAEMIGTPLYMSPEQADISATDVDTRADVYSLGVLLYELLTGTTPFEREKFRAASLDEIRRTIREEEPPRPSARVTTLRATCTSTCPRCRGEPRRLIQTLRGELDWIVMKALEKDRTRRYQSARELAEDVRRYLGNEAVQACPPSKPYRLRKLAARHKAALATLSLVAASLLAGTAVSIWQAMEADAARKLADARAEDERRARIEASEREASLRRELYATDVNVAWHFWEEGDKRRCLELLDRHRPRGDQADLRGFEWHYLSTLARKKWTILTGHQAPLLTADALPDGRLVAGADRSGVVKVWDPATGHELQTLRYGTLEVSCVRFSPDGRRLATAGQDRLIHLWDVATSAETARLAGHELTICSIAWSPDGRMIASAARDHSVRVWDVENQGEARLLSGHTDVVRSVAWSPDGKLLASGGADLTVRLWDTVSWRPAGDLGGHNEGLLAVAFSPDGRWLASAGYNTSIIIHDVARRKELARIPQPGNVWSLAFAPDSRLLAVGRNEGRLSLYQIDDHAGKLSQLRSEIDFTGAIRAVVFAQAGETLVLAVEEDQAIGSGRVASLTGRQGRSFSGDSLAADFDRDLVATADPAGTILLRSFRAGDVLTRIAVHGARVLDAAFAPRAEVLASCSIDGSVCLSSTRTGEVLHRLEVAEPPVRSLAFSADGALLAGSGDKGAVNLWQTESGELIRTLKAPEGSPAAVAFAPDGKVLATGSYGKIALWETCAGRRLAVLESHLKGTSDLAFSPDGSLLAACGDSHVSLWDLSTGREAAILMGHRGSVYGAAFSPDGRTLATLGQDETVRLWQVATRRELFALARFNRPPTWLCFASSGALLVGTAADEQGSSEVLVFGASR